MISRLIGYAVGWRELGASGGDRAAFVNIVGRCGERVYSQDLSGERFTCRASDKAAKRIAAECGRLGVEVSLSPLRGLTGLLYRCRRRYGLFVGAILLVSLTAASRYFIWDIEVVGNESVPTEQIVAGLEALGVAPGAFIPGIDFELAANDFLLASDDIAWISVNMRSSLAVVEVLERKKPEANAYSDRRRDGYANLVASEDAEIVLARITSGKRVVSPGDVVRRGELLATGEIELRDGTLRYEYASGEVMAKVYRRIVAEVGVNGTRRVATGEETVRKSVKIFGKSKNLFVNSGNIYNEYDKIVSEEKLTVFGSVVLPVTVRCETLREYRTEPCVFTEDEARELAERDFGRQLDALLSDAELASISRTHTFDGERYVITGDLYIIKDVARAAEIIPETGDEKEKTDDTENDND